MNGYILYSTYSTIEGKTIVQLFGRLENGESFVTLNEVKPYFFIKKKDEKHATPLLKPYKTLNTKLKNFSEDPVLKVEFPTKADLNERFKSLYKEIEIYEADLRPHYRFIIDNDLLGTIKIDGDYQGSEKIDRVYTNPSISPSNFKPDLKVVSIDTESGPGGKLYNIGLYTKDYQKTIMLTKHKLKNVIPCNSEAEMLEKFKTEIVKLDPDIITGWNVIDFDFAYLRDLYNNHKIKFDIGRTNDNPRIRIESNFFRSSSVDIPGRQVLDGLNLIKDPFIKEAPSIKNAKLDSLSLEAVAQALVKKGKLLKGKDRHEQIIELFEKNTSKSHQKLADYNILDCELAYDILEKTKVIDLAIERSQLTGLQFDKLTASIVAFDSLYIREARKRGYVSPTMNYQAKEQRITGGYVRSASAGIYNNVLVLDFKSLYPSIIKTFNIDPAALLPKKQKSAIESPNKAYFKNNNGILPDIIENLHTAREKAKKEKRELSNHAIKVIMNSFFGVLASPNCRFFSMDMANAITHFGQFLIKLTASEIEKGGHKVIYSDTDSVFVESNSSKTKAQNLGLEIQTEINSFYDNFVNKNYNRKSYLELEFEKQYLSLMIPQVRNAKSESVAAKKRYAGLKVLPGGKEKLEIVGLEAIRGDWTDAAQEFQIELLNKLFHSEKIDTFIRNYIKKIREGKLDTKLIYRKSIRKSLDEYTKTTPPHVKAARKLPKLESNVIEYIITLDGPEPIQLQKSKIDYKHYIEKQIKPIANQILSLQNKSFDDLISDSKQSTLF